MNDNECNGPSKCGWVESERMLAKTFESWRAEFREILENHRRDIQSRLEAIERRLEAKSDKESVEIIVRGINDELARHAEEISSLKSEVKTKVSGDTLWKTVALVIALGGVISGVVSSIISYFGR
ncbi:MAG: hypothetical protein ABFD49_06980 [Armatimonadota bacterium]|nr:hypothetical protein [bacterium]